MDCGRLVNNLRTAQRRLLVQMCVFTELGTFVVLRTHTYMSHELLIGISESPLCRASYRVLSSLSLSGGGPCGHMCLLRLLPRLQTDNFDLFGNVCCCSS